MVRHQLTVRGSLSYDHPDDFSATLASATPSPGRALRARYPLAEARHAFRAARETAGKTWISGCHAVRARRGYDEALRRQGDDWPWNAVTISAEGKAGMVVDRRGLAEAYGVAARWRARFGLAADPHWDGVADGLVRPPVRDGIYDAPH